ncbi:hypothetical protein C4D60_Mb07t19440 [Musa balbisiana]|uniref:Uncharacterized protein n=1 Tax=Musa balbisiana TaxID=52838 RepID=A0A4S8JGG2_MUSBA|nr:hypothetical protein C4D60_Mb07t19440 [Musa balbisiana]
MVGGRESGAGASAGEVIIPLEWEEAAEEISRASSPPPVVFICGPKNSGKSTFSRYLLNVLLPRYGKVGYLDTDVGQPEFSPPGYLMNPCIRATERCFFFGDVSSKSDPKAYLDCTFNLYDYFIRVHYQPNELNHPGKALPLIINTPGWVKGTGFDLLVEKLRYISPPQVVQIRISVESKNLPGSTFWLDSDQQEPHIYLLNSARHNNENQSILVRKDASRMRDQRLFDYFKQCFPSNLNILTNKELAHALAAIAPYVVPFAKIKVVHLHCQVPSSEIFHSLNATIVGLAVSSDVPAKSRSNTQQQVVDSELIQNEASHRLDTSSEIICCATGVWSSGPEHATPNSQQQEGTTEASRRGDRTDKRDPQREHQQQQGDGDRGRLLLDPLAAGGGDGGENKAEAREHVQPDEQEEGEVDWVCRVELGSCRDGRVDTDANHRRKNQLPCRPPVR